MLPAPPPFPAGAQRVNLKENMLSEVGNDVLRSARVFAVAVRKVFEEEVLGEVAGPKVNFSQLKLLYLVTQAEPHNISGAAAFLGVSKAAASKSVDKLVRRKLLKRTDVETDRRTSQLTLTDAGRKLLKAYEEARNKLAEKVLSSFSEQELRVATEVLDRLTSAVGVYSSSPGEICMQCSIYTREKCRFGELGQQACLFHRYRGQKPEAVEQDENGSYEPREVF